MFPRSLRAQTGPPVCCWHTACVDGPKGQLMPINPCESDGQSSARVTQRVLRRGVCVCVCVLHVSVSVCLCVCVCV